jgi:hypothetical protein
LSVETIAKSCFKSCVKLSELTFESGSRLSSLGESAFDGCSSLRSICLPASIETIGPSCFDHCTNPSRIVLESGCRVSDECLSGLRSICQLSLK